MNFSNIWTLRFIALHIFWFIVKGDESHCPPDVPQTQVFTYMDTCYHFLPTSTYTVSYDSAKSDCRSRRGLLLTLENNATAAAVSQLLNNHVDSHTILLGLRKVGGTWKWATGSSMTFTKFDTTQRATQDADCAKLKLMEGVWEKSACGNTDWFSIYVCQHNQKTIDMTGGGQQTGSTLSVLFSVVVSIAVLFSLH